MNYEFDVQMDEKILYDFMLHHNYKSGTGYLWPLIGVLALGLAIFSGNAPVAYRLAYAAFGLLFIFFIPFDLKGKTKKQLAKNPYYKKPIHYVVNEEGIKTSQDEQETFIPWERFRKLNISKRSLIVYLPNQSACVMPKECFGDKYEEVALKIMKKIKESRSKKK